MRRFERKTAVVTGASAGIGEACARKLAAEGANVVLAARGKEGLERLVQELGTEVALAVPTDVTDCNACERLLQATRERFGNLDILVNNAGFNSRGPLQEIPVDEVTQMVDVNLRAPALLTRLALPDMLAKGSGVIVNVASLAGRFPLDDDATYSAAKFGLRAFSFALAEELRGTNVKVAVVSPGPVETDFLMRSIDQVPDLTFSQEMSTAEQIADMVVQSAFDGRRERAKPVVGAKLATVGYLFPAVRRALKPALERKGRKTKEKYRSKYGSR